MYDCTENQHFDLLTSLGFEPYTPPSMEERLRIDAEIDVELLPDESSVPQFSEQVEPPCFLMYKGAKTGTIAIVETGSIWICRGKCVDLTPIGFAPMFEAHTLQ